MVYDKIIKIQKFNEEVEEWEDLFPLLHANINKHKSDDKYLGSKAIQDKISFVFRVRYFKAIEEIFANLQIYRIVYNGINYEIVDYDDYKLKHQSVKLLGVSYGQ